MAKKKEKKTVISENELAVAKCLNQQIVAKYTGKALPIQRLVPNNEYLIRIEKDFYGYFFDIIENITIDESIHTNIMYSSSISILAAWNLTNSLDNDNI